MKKQITIDVDYKDMLLTCCTKVNKGNRIDTKYYTCKSLEDCVTPYFKDKLGLSIDENTAEETVKEINDQYFNFSVSGEYSSITFYMIDGDIFVLPQGEF